MSCRMRWPDSFSRNPISRISKPFSFNPTFSNSGIYKIRKELLLLLGCSCMFAIPNIYFIAGNKYFVDCADAIPVTSISGDWGEVEAY